MLELTEEQAIFLKKPMLVYIGTKRSDGSIQINPAWFEFRDGYFFLNSVKGRHWPAHIEKEREATLAFFDPEDARIFLEIEAKPVEIIEEGAKDHINELSIRYTGKPFELPNGEKRIKIKMEPVKVNGTVK